MMHWLRAVIHRRSTGAGLVALGCALAVHLAAPVTAQIVAPAAAPGATDVHFGQPVATR